MFGGHYNGLLAYANANSRPNGNISLDEVVDDVIDSRDYKSSQSNHDNKYKPHNEHQVALKANKNTNNSSVNSGNNFDAIINAATTYKHFIKNMNSPARPTTVKNFVFCENALPAPAVTSPKSTTIEQESFEKYEKLNYKQKLTSKPNTTHLIKRLNSAFKIFVFFKKNSPIIKNPVRVQFVL
jgi:hypothetical protein